MRKIKCFGLVFFILGILAIISPKRREYYPSEITVNWTQESKEQKISPNNLSRS